MAERKVADGSRRHSGQRLTSWAVANARVEPKGNAIIITKQASGTAKIDSFMAAFNAIALMSTNPWSTRPSIFVI
jgi:phage terminase large subunit-like protein